ncbi:MAG: hypothetical protein ABIU54_01865 [Candidatus Eisenbacteria bacterium]
MPPEPVLTEEDRAVLERVAERVVELRLETPAILTLEGLRPMSVLTGTAMLFFEPIILMLFRLPDYRRFAALVERRDALEALSQSIETRAGARERARESANKRGT